MSHSSNSYPSQVEQYDVFEITLPGRTDGNPFTDHTLSGVFEGEHETLQAAGFYDGNGLYKVRFMPSHTGTYHFRVTGSFSDAAHDGTFEVTPAQPGNHGPVRVANRHHFAYADGTPYLPVGTTCYVWTHQDPEIQAQTLETLRNSPFNKIRCCVLPKHYIYNFTDPVSFPFEGTPCDRSDINESNFKYEGTLPGNRWDFTRFNTAHFQAFEQRIRDLMTLGIEADIIVMHPYDCWGFCRMTPEQDDRYWRYVIARFSAFRNVWWSLANEYDFMREKTEADWERYAALLVNEDPHQRLRSIHNGTRIYDHSRDWITHCSIQSSEVSKTNAWLAQYDKPVILDEMCYEGDIDQGWGNITGQEMSHRCWEVAMRGGYIGHGETYLYPASTLDKPDTAEPPQPHLWWSHGGVLHGESVSRIAFLKTLLESVPGNRLRPVDFAWDVACAVPEDPAFEETCKFIYFGIKRPSFRNFHFDDTCRYRVEIIDTWHMTIRDAGIHQGWFKVRLPGVPHICLRITRVAA